MTSQIEGYFSENRISEKQKSPVSGAFLLYFEWLSASAGKVFLNFRLHPSQV
jgi:hypothetical protein